MKTVGIVAEYNPFHAGHRKQFDRIRAEFGDKTAIVCAMSGNFVQRGAPAVLDKTHRAKAAVACGADLVVELPTSVSLSSAEGFAAGGVGILSKLCDTLCFGAETGETASLMETARALLSEDFSPLLRRERASGKSFPAARAEALAQMGLSGEILRRPNDILAVEYCKAILELGAALVPIPLPRQGAGHGQALTETGGQFASASALRTLWQNGGADAAAPYVPAEVLPLYREAFAAGQYTDLAAAQRCQLALLRSRCAGTAPFAQVRGISEGLEHRLEAAVRSSTTHAELLDSLTTVRYPRARMRRLAMDAALDYSADAFPALPPYLHLLGAQKDALPLLKAAALPVSHSLARLAEQNAPCRAVVDAQLRACDFGALCRKKPEPMGSALRQKIIFLTK